MTDLRQRLADEGFGVGTWQEPTGERAIEIDDALRVFAEWLRERAEAARAQPAGRGVCRCGRPTVVSERAGRITALGALADEIALKGDDGGVVA